MAERIPGIDFEPRVTKTLEQFAAKNADKISEFYAESDGVFIHLKDGWCDAHGAHIIRGDTATLAIARFRRMVRKEE